MAKKPVNPMLAMVEQLGYASGDATGHPRSTSPHANPLVFISEAGFSAAENQTGAFTAVSTDADGPLVYSIEGGDDAAFFSIDSGTGVVSFLVAPNFEAPTDANADNVYEVTVGVTDGLNPMVTQEVAVTVTDVGELPPPPVITSGNAFNFAENGVGTVFTVTATGTGTLTYSLEGGADAADFSIVPATGVVTFNVSPDFEAPHDADTNNVYLLQVGVSDGQNPVVTQNVSVTVTDVVEVAATVALSHFEAASLDPLVDEMPGVFWNEFGLSTTVVTDTDPKFGTGHIVESSGSGMYLYGFDPLTNDDDWTIEYWFKNVTHSFTSAVVYGYSTPGTPDTGPTPTSSRLSTEMRQGDVQLILRDATDVDILTLTSASGPSMDVYHHAAFVKDGTTARMFVDGVELDSDTIVGVVDDIVALRLTDNGPFTAKFDEFRVSRVARYTANFTPPAAPFVVD